MRVRMCAGVHTPLLCWKQLLINRDNRVVASVPQVWRHTKHGGVITSRWMSVAAHPMASGVVMVWLVS